MPLRKWLLPVLLLGVSGATWGQVPTGVLTGLVKDSSGAVVPNVKVTAINTGTNLTRQVVTDTSGTYRIAALNPGPYRLEAEAGGFKKLPPATSPSKSAPRYGSTSNCRSARLPRLWRSPAAPR